MDARKRNGERPRSNGHHSAVDEAAACSVEAGSSDVASVAGAESVDAVSAAASSVGTASLAPFASLHSSFGFRGTHGPVHKASFQHHAREATGHGCAAWQFRQDGIQMSNRTKCAQARLPLQLAFGGRHAAESLPRPCALARRERQHREQQCQHRPHCRALSRRVHNQQVRRAPYCAQSAPVSTRYQLPGTGRTLPGIYWYI